MKVMVLVKANKDSEAGKLPDTSVFEAMTRFNEELVKAGVMLAGEGLARSAEGARIRFEGKKRTVTDGPFAETRELVGGFWIIQVKSKAEAIEWMKRAPFDGGTEIELRRVHELSDFPDFSEQGKAEEERMRAQSGYAERK